MTALLRADAYRVLRSRWVWAFVVAMTLIIFAPALLMRWTGMGPVSFDRLTGSAVSLGGTEILAAVMTSLVCADKASLGFDRSVLSALGPRARRLWFAEKCVFAALLALVVVAYAFLLGLVAVPVSGVPVTDPEPAWQVAAWFGCAWLVSAAYAALTALVGELTRSEAVTLGFAVLASTGLLEGGLVVGIDALCYLAGGSFLDFSSAVAPWLLSQVIGAVGEGAATLLSADNAVGLSPAVRALVVCPPVIAAATAANAFLVSRRDVA